MKRIVVSAGIAALAYPILVFITLDWNVANWPEQYRVNMVAISAFAFFAAITCPAWWMDRP